MTFTAGLLKSIYNEFLDVINPSMIEFFISNSETLTASEKAVLGLYYAAIKSGSPPTDEMFETTVKHLNIEEGLTNYV